VKGDNKASRAQVLLAEVIRESGGDAERARWLLKTAGKKVHRGSPLKGRIRLQNSLLDIAEGKLDQAETTIRALAEKDPTNHRIFMALSTMLEARGQVIPAHAEMLRARDRSGANSLDRIAYQREIERIQALIESGITNIDYGLDDILGDASIPVAAPAAPRENVVRRRPGKKAKAAAEE
jgi:ATP/maltotriose-dependent transcriptional regulator MalT